MTPTRKSVAALPPAELLTIGASSAEQASEEPSPHQYLRNMWSGQYLTAAGGDRPGYQVRVSDFTGCDKQQWFADRQPSGMFVLRNSGSVYDLSATAVKMESIFEIRIQLCDGRLGQQFALSLADGSEDKIGSLESAKYPGYTLGIRGRDSQALLVPENHRDPKQQWYVESVVPLISAGEPQPANGQRAR